MYCSCFDADVQYAMEMVLFNDHAAVKVTAAARFPISSEHTCEL